MSLGDVEFTIVFRLLFVVRKTIAVISEFTSMLVVVVDDFYNMACERNNLLLSAQILQHLDFAFESNNTGIHLVNMTLSVKVGYYAAEFGETFLLLA